MYLRNVFITEIKSRNKIEKIVRGAFKINIPQPQSFCNFKQIVDANE